MNCIFLDSIVPEMKQILLSQKPDDMEVVFWDELDEKEKKQCQFCLMHKTPYDFPTTALEPLVQLTPQMIA